MTPAAKTPSPSNPESLAELHAQFSPAALWQRRMRRNALTTAWGLTLSISAWTKRFLDVLFSAMILTALLPAFVVMSFAFVADGRPIFTSEPRVGRWSVPFQMLAFNTERKCGGILRRLWLQRIPVLINVLRGDMSLIGPRAVRPDELDVRQRAARKRSSVRPGLLSLWWLRKKANIHFSSELEIDLEYIDSQSIFGDLGIGLRAAPSLFYGASSSTAPPQIDVLGVHVDNLTMDETLQYILDAAGGPIPRQLCFVNTDCINKSIHDQDYKELLDKSDLTLADGIGIRLAGKITRREIRQNVNGTDLFPLLCQRLQGSELGLFLLGARPEVVEAFTDWIRKTYPAVRVKGHHNGFFDSAQEESVLKEVRDSGSEILLVAFGAPRQDLWIRTHLQDLGPVRIAMGVGGLFDFYSGRIPRAPQWMRELSLEWTFRLYQEPGRMWRRYLVGNVVFLWRVILSTLFQRSGKKRSEEV